MKKLIVLLFSIGLWANSHAQNMPDLAIYKVHITQPDKSIIAETRPIGSLPTADPDRLYYWFSANAIKTTQGGYSGHLLNGQYKEFYLNKNLKEEGEFSKGLKNGVWKSWSPDGVLLHQTIWEDGAKNGAFAVYDDKGKLKQKGVYKSDVIVPNAKPSSLWNKINIFKKKDKSTNGH